MATFTKAKLSGSTNGKQIKVVHTTSGTGDTIHTAVSGTSSWDEIWIYAYNDNATAVNLTINFGGSTEPDNKIMVSVPAQAGRLLVCDGMLLQNGLVVKAYAGSANVIILDGFVNQIT